MLALKQIGPPAQSEREGEREWLIGVRILISRDEVHAHLFPDQNRIGTQILCRLLQARVELAGAQVSQCGCRLEFNRSFYLLLASKLEPCLQAIKNELQELGLLKGAQIAWHDPREGVFRVWHPTMGRFDIPSEESTNAENAVVEALAAAIREQRQSEHEPPGQ